MTSLVIGASGFLGSTLTRRLVESGEDVRILVRPSSDTRTIDDLDVDRHVGELNHADSVADAMSGCTDVYHCAVDTRAWLLDPAPLYETNVELLRSVLEVAARISLRRFVFTSTMATIGIPESGLADEATEFNWDRRATDYVRSRVAAERLALSYAREHDVPLVAMCVSNTYGAGDVVPTPTGRSSRAPHSGSCPSAYVECVVSRSVSTMQRTRSSSLRSMDAMANATSFRSGRSISARSSVLQRQPLDVPRPDLCWAAPRSMPPARSGRRSRHLPVPRASCASVRCV